MIPQLSRDQTCSTLLGTLFRKLQENGFEGVLSTGYSCQAQASRIEHLSLRHPLEIIDKS